ncbi:MAG: ornithine carbamoyltransferase, partial [Firmicutes bacterium]|nr:ornithine carbamoyltransferase [Bacillota bacterium]
MDWQLLRNLRGRDFLTDQDYSREELVALLDLAAAIK